MGSPTLRPPEQYKSIHVSFTLPYPNTSQPYAHLSSTRACVIGLGWRYSATTPVAADTGGCPRMRQIPWGGEEGRRKRKRYEKSVKVPVAAGTEGCQRMRRIPWGREKQGGGGRGVKAV